MIQTKRQKVGALGEEIVSQMLSKKGFRIVDRNYRKKWGEIDIVAQKGVRIYFVEVKSVTKELPRGMSFIDKLLGRKGQSADIRDEDDKKMRPEENVHPWKQKRLARAIQTYLLEKNFSVETPWQLDIAIVYIDVENKRSRVRFLENIVLGGE